MLKHPEDGAYEDENMFSDIKHKSIFEKNNRVKVFIEFPQIGR